jgi:hypothetical protein
VGQGDRIRWDQTGVKDAREPLGVKRRATKQDAVMPFISKTPKPPAGGMMGANGARTRHETMLAPDAASS